MFKSFEYLRPQSIEEAVSLGNKYGPDARYIAGGTDVLVKLRSSRKETPKYLISLRQIKEMQHIKTEKGNLRIGALTTHRELENSDLIKENYEVLYDAVSQVGSVQIRNVATIGGNICSSLPSADTASPLLVLGAQVKIAGPKGERIVSLQDFFQGPGSNILNPGEIMTEIIVPSLSASGKGAYYKHGRRKAMEIPLVASAVYLVTDVKGVCKEARIALTTAAPVPLLTKRAADELLGKEVTYDALQKAGEIAVQESSPRSSFRSTAEYRRSVIPVIVRRAGLLALERIQNKS